MEVWQFGHEEGGKAIEISFGILKIHTFKKLPIDEPKINDVKRIKLKEYIKLLSFYFRLLMALISKKREIPDLWYCQLKKLYYITKIALQREVKIFNLRLTENHNLESVQ